MIEKRVVKTNRDIFGGHCIRNDDDVLGVGDLDK